ncbi:MAG: type I glutamate--ammonia ligase [Gemmatimonadota bacterium]|jgi:glutamine synthetase
MFETYDDVRRFIADADIEMIDLRYTDPWGRWHNVTFPAARFTPALLEDGVGFDGSAVGLRGIESGDMVLVPDLTTGSRDPFAEVATLGFLCTTLESEQRQPFSDDPRNVARRAEEYLRESGIATESRWGPEFEFFVFDAAYFENEVNRSSFRIESREGGWDESGHGRPVDLAGGYHAIAPKDQLHDLRTEISMLLEGMGVPIKYHHHEVGGPGQVEIETQLLGLTEAADKAMLVKYVAKMVAQRHGQTATFMPKPLFGVAGSGMHFHQQLLGDGVNLFHDDAGYGSLSELAHQYVAGLLTHAPALLALTNPSTNSYRRLVPGYEAPVNAFFSVGNRSAAVRIPGYTNRPEATRIEFRPPDATCNPYLAVAAQLMAGLDGIRRRLDPTEAGFGPIDEDIFSWTEERRRQVGRLPGTLEEALTALEADHAFLLEGDVFTEDLVDHWVRHKREKEARAVRIRPHPYEVMMYFDV